MEKYNIGNELLFPGYNENNVYQYVIIPDIIFQKLKIKEDTFFLDIWNLGQYPPCSFYAEWIKEYHIGIPDHLCRVVTGFSWDEYFHYINKVVRFSKRYHLVFLTNMGPINFNASEIKMREPKLIEL